jgi:hypothetical protein
MPSNATSLTGEQGQPIAAVDGKRNDAVTPCRLVRVRAPADHPRARHAVAVKNRSYRSASGAM